MRDNVYYLMAFYELGKKEDLKCDISGRRLVAAE